MFHVRILFALTLTACAGDDPVVDPRDDSPPPVEEVCLDPRYGNGTCDTQLSCDSPDIDCFRVFADDDEAAAWFGPLEAEMAAEAGRPPRVVVPTSDPRHATMRALLDQGWEAFRDTRPVGELAEARPALVLVETSEINAFVMPETFERGRAAFAIMVNTSIVAQQNTDDANLGLFMHELQHIVGLHVVAGVDDQVRRFYIAPAGTEPIGNDMIEDPIAREAGLAWLDAAEEVGPYSQLGGLPLVGDLDDFFKDLFGQAIAADEAGCARSSDLVAELRSDLVSIDPLDGSLDVDPFALESRANAAIAVLRDECFAGVQTTFIEAYAEYAEITPAELEAQMSAEDRALVTDKHLIDALAALTFDRRDRMRAIEASFASETGRPWSALRYFSTEEDADDVSVPVLRAANLDPAGLATFMFSLLDSDTRPRCGALLDDGEVPPYGFDLTDSHHATCWRVDHINAVTELPARSRRIAPPVVSPARVSSRLPIRPRKSAVIVY